MYFLRAGRVLVLCVFFCWGGWVFVVVESILLRILREAIGPKLPLGGE